MAAVVGIMVAVAALVAVITGLAWLGAEASENQGDDVVLLDGSRAKLATGRRVGKDDWVYVPAGGGDSGGGGGYAEGGGGGE